jgi:hypothetical protein
MLVAFLKADGWLSRSTYTVVEQSGGRLGLFAFLYEQSMYLIFCCSNAGRVFGI